MAEQKAENEHTLIARAGQRNPHNGQHLIHLVCGTKELADKIKNFFIKKNIHLAEIENRVELNKTVYILKTSSQVYDEYFPGKNINFDEGFFSKLTEFFDQKFDFPPERTSKQLIQRLISAIAIIQEYQEWFTKKQVNFKNEVRQKINNPKLFERDEASNYRIHPYAILSTLHNILEVQLKIDPENTNSNFSIQDALKILNQDLDSKYVKLSHKLPNLPMVIDVLIENKFVFISFKDKGLAKLVYEALYKLEKDIALIGTKDGLGEIRLEHKNFIKIEEHLKSGNEIEMRYNNESYSVSFNPILENSPQPQHLSPPKWDKFDMSKLCGVKMGTQYIQIVSPDSNFLGTLPLILGISNSPENFAPGLHVLRLSPEKYKELCKTKTIFNAPLEQLNSKFNYGALNITQVNANQPYPVYLPTPSAPPLEKGDMHESDMSQCPEVYGTPTDGENIEKWTKHLREYTAPLSVGSSSHILFSQPQPQKNNPSDSPPENVPEVQRRPRQPS